MSYPPQPPPGGPPPHPPQQPPPSPPAQWPGPPPYQPGYAPQGYQQGPPPRRSRLPIVLAMVAAAVVLIVAMVVPLVVFVGDDGDPATKDDSDRSDTGGTTDNADDVDTSNLDLVRSYEDLETTHEEGDITYPQSPPVGGHHASEWLECGVYDTPVPEENMVHDLEHGTVWLTYREDKVDEGGVDALEDQLPDNGILSPYPDQEAPVVITTWGRQLELVGADDPRIALFVEEYGAGETAPEPFASCAGGTADPGTDI